LSAGWLVSHFNTGSEPARHLALRMGGRVYPTGFYSCLKKYDDAVMTSLKDGGTMIDYDEEDPEIKIRFEKSLKENGTPLRCAAGGQRIEEG